MTFVILLLIVVLGVRALGVVEGEPRRPLGGETAVGYSRCGADCGRRTGDGVLKGAARISGAWRSGGGRTGTIELLVVVVGRAKVSLLGAGDSHASVGMKDLGIVGKVADESCLVLVDGIHQHVEDGGLLCSSPQRLLHGVEGPSHRLAATLRVSKLSHNPAKYLRGS